MERKFLIFKTHGELEVSAEFCSEIDNQIGDIVQQCTLGMATPSPLNNTGLSCCVLPNKNWTKVTSRESVENSVSTATSISHDPESLSSLADALHSMLDSLGTPGTTILAILWLSDVPPVSFHPALFGALQRAVSWHGSSVTIITENVAEGCQPNEDGDWMAGLRAECLPLSYICSCHKLTEFLSPALVWRGGLAFYHEDPDSGPGLLDLPGFELHADKDSLDLAVAKLRMLDTESPSPITPIHHYSTQLEVVTSVHLSSVPHHLLTSHKLLLKTPILDEDDFAQQLMDESLRSHPDQAMLLKLKFSTNSPRNDLSKLKTEAWKSSVINCNFDPVPPCASLGTDVSSVNILIFDDPDIDGDCSRSTCQKAGVILSNLSDLKNVGSLRQFLSQGQSKTHHDKLEGARDILVNSGLPIFSVDERKLVLLKQYVRRVQAAVLEMLLESNAEYLKNNKIEDILVAVQDRIIKDIGLSCTNQPITNEHINELQVAHKRLQDKQTNGYTEEWQEKRFLQFLQLHSQRAERKAESKILKPKEDQYVLLEAAELLKLFDKRGNSTKKLEPTEAKNKNCPLRPQKTKDDYEQLLVENFEKVELDFKGFKFKGDDFSKVEFTQYHDVYYNTGDKAESYDRECKTMRDHYVGITKETSSTFSSAGGGPDKFKMATTAKKSMEKEEKKTSNSIEINPRRTSPRKKVTLPVMRGKAPPQNKLTTQATKRQPEVKSRPVKTQPKVEPMKRRSVEGGNSNDLTDDNRKRLRRAVYEALVRKDINEGDTLFRPCFAKLFNICKIYVVDSQQNPETCTTNWMREICKLNVDTIVTIEKMKLPKKK